MIGGEWSMSDPLWEIMAAGRLMTGRRKGKVIDTGERMDDWAKWKENILETKQCGKMGEATPWKIGWKYDLKQNIWMEKLGWNEWEWETMGRKWKNKIGKMWPEKKRAGRKSEMEWIEMGKYERK